jgi:hypothetical protein
VTTRVAIETVDSLDDLELELRKLPGVRAAGFEERDDVLYVQLHVADTGERPDQPVPVSASRIAARHSNRPVAVEVVRWRTAPAPAAVTAPEPLAPAPAAAPDDRGDADGETPARRARLLAVLAFPETDELEVHLVLEGRRTIGRAPASRGLVGAAEATVDAVAGFGAAGLPQAKWARALEDTTDDDRVVVAVALEDLDGGPLQYGLAAGASPIDAAARAALDGLNRRLARVLRPA